MTDEELRGLLETSAGETRRELGAAMQEMHILVADTAADTRHLFEITAEGMRADVQTLAAGLGALEEKVDGKFAEVSVEFRDTRSLIQSSYTRLDRRVSALEQERHGG